MTAIHQVRRWTGLTDVDLQYYKLLTDVHLRNIELPVDRFKYAVCFIKTNEQTMRANSMAKR